jgi:hypothetical protein
MGVFCRRSPQKIPTSPNSRIGSIFIGYQKEYR